MSGAYTITRAQLEGLAQLITTLDDGEAPAEIRIEAAAQAHNIVAEVLGCDANFIYPQEDAA